MKHSFFSPLFRFRRSASSRKSPRARATGQPSRTFQPQLETLESRLAPAVTALGAGPLGQPLVTILNEAGAVAHTFPAYDPRFLGGVNVAQGDVTGDGIADIVTGAGPGGGPHVKVFDGATFAEVRSFFAYDPRFLGGVNVATADVDANGVADIVTGAGPGGGPHVQVFDGRTQAVLRSFFAYDSTFLGGVSVTAGDLNGDLLPDLITGAGPGGGPHVRAFDVATGLEVASFFAYDSSFLGGVNVATGDVDGNGTVELLTGAGPGGGPHVRAWTGGPTPTVIGEFMALGGSDSGGVRVGSTLGANGTPDRIVATRQLRAGPLEVSDLTGRVLSTNLVAAGGAAGTSVSSSVTQPDLLLRYHSLSQVAVNGGAGRIEPLASGGFRLTLKGVRADTQVQYFADAPGRGTGQDTLAAFVNQVWPRQYGAVGANAFAVAQVGNVLSGSLFRLTNPQLNLAAGTLTFDATTLEDSPGPDGPVDIDRLTIGLSPNDVTASGGPIPAVNRGAVHSFVIAAEGGSLSVNGRAGTLTLDRPLDPSAQFSSAPSQTTHVESVQAFVDAFGQRFGTRTPNAAVLFQDESGAASTVTVNLASARVVSGSAVFDVAYTGTPRSGRLTLPLLFVDSSAPVTTQDVCPDPGENDPLRMPAPCNPSGDRNAVYYSDAELLRRAKTITLTNNSGQTIYPFLRGVNDGKYQGVANQQYDSIDPNNEEYRAYIGHKVGNDYFFGLENGKSVTFNVPLAFWDGARMAIATDPRFLKNRLKVGDALENNPYQYYKYERDGTTQTLRVFDELANNNVVMWYHSRVAMAPLYDAPDQLIEFTIRDPYQRVLNPNLPASDAPCAPIDCGYLGPLFNYDVSFVDSIYYPVAMSAPHVPYGRDQQHPAGADPFGWAGTVLRVDQMQGPLQDFTSMNAGTSGLGTYFDGLGWSKFNIPGQANIKLPSGAGIFQNSAYADHLSTYRTVGPDNFVDYVLSNSGREYRVAPQNLPAFSSPQKRIDNVDPSYISQLAKGMTVIDYQYFEPGVTITDLGIDRQTQRGFIELSDPPTRAPFPGSRSLTFIGSRLDNLNGTFYTASVDGDKMTLANRSLLATLKEGMLVSSPGSSLQPETRIKSLPTDPDADPRITLDKPAGPSSGNRNYTFSGAPSDYVADRLMNLWFGWANYYVERMSRVPPTVTVPQAYLDRGHRILAFPPSVDVSGLVAGMPVFNNGLPAGTILDGTIITGFGNPAVQGNTDKHFVHLSQIAGGSLSGNHAVVFGRPQPIADRLPNTKLVSPLRLQFGTDATAEAEEFAESVYVVMAAMTNKELPANEAVAIGFMTNVIGFNIGTQNVNPDIGAELRDRTKSVLRGVADFVKYPETSGKWYPDPSRPTPGATVNNRQATFGVYNLDPYVWFIHEKLGLSGYAFSVDDDAADVSAVGSHELTISIGGLTGLGNLAEWTVGAPYGPVSTTGARVVDRQGNTPDRVTSLTPENWYKLGSPDLRSGALGALVNGAAIAPGTRVAKKVEADRDIVFAVDLDKDLLPVPGGRAYSFFGRVRTSGRIDPTRAPRTIAGLEAHVLDTLSRIAIAGTPLPGSLSISGPGVRPGTRIQSINYQDGSLLLDQDLLPNTAAGTYTNRYAIS